MLREDSTGETSPSAFTGLGGHLPVLDGLRGLAILLVLMNNLYPGNPDRYVDRIVYLVSNIGWSGVDLFFVLSGFLITGILYDTRGAQHYFRNFYARRFLRIFPLAYGYLALIFLVVAHIASMPATEAHALAHSEWWYWSYLGNLKIALHGEGSALEPTMFWSLAVEEQFYLLWPLVVALLDRRRLVTLCIAMIATALLLRVGWHVVDPSKQGREALYVLTASRMDGLAMGALLAIGLRNTGVAFHIQRWAKPVALAALPALALLFVWRRGLLATDTVVQTIGYSIIVLGAGSVLVLSLAAPVGSPLERVFTHPFMRFFGRYSYAMYVLQGLVRYVAWPRPFVRDPPLLFGSQVPAATAICLVLSGTTVVLAVLSYHLYERRFLSLKRFFPYAATPDAAQASGVALPLPAGDTPGGQR
ncbi:MAG TPA: acyltransferase [Gemmatimonadaceae bacterium]